MAIPMSASRKDGPLLREVTLFLSLISVDDCASCVLNVLVCSTCTHGDELGTKAAVVFILKRMQYTPRTCWSEIMVPLIADDNAEITSWWNIVRADR